nr:gamma-tubulin complex component 4 homolog [Tanacetum cinerariifolium]
SFLEESRQLMRLPPGQSIAKAGLMVPFWLSFLEESRQLMRLPPGQSIAKAGLMVPFWL